MRRYGPFISFGALLIALIALVVRIVIDATR